MRRLLLGLAAVAATLAGPQDASAHRLGEGYIFLNVEASGLRGYVQVMLSDLERAVPMDGNGDGIVSDAEFEIEADRVKTYVAERVGVGADGRDYDLRFTSHEVLSVTLGRFAQLNFVAEGVTAVPDVIDVEYHILFAENPEHRGFAVTESNVKTGVDENEAIPSLIFTPEATRQQLDLTAPLTPATFLSFVWQGIWHIWIGIDHILFVLSLVMAVVLIPSDEDSGFTATLIRLAKVITLFTLAHSVTLSLAALGWVNLSPRIVESVIALSVVAAALNNIYPLFRDWTWTVVFAFGLFHGFGFASVLGHITQARMALTTTLLGFNVGVELGQLAVIAVAFPILYALRSQPAIAKPVLRFGSLAIALMAAMWFVERAFELG